MKAIRSVSYPPFIVFFDTIAVFLFLLVLNQDRRLEIEIPQNRLFYGAEIIYKKDSNYYNISGGLFIPSQLNMDAAYLLDCKQQLECREAKIKHGNNVALYILLPKPIYREIAELTVAAFGTKACAGLKYTINESGVLDYTEIQKNNPCLNKLSGFNKRVKQQG